MAKSYGIALILWATFGLFGAHHFYLGRDRQGVIHLLTLGGFTLAWLWDLIQLRSYVRWANFDRSFKEKYLQKVEKNDRPGESLVKNVLETVLCQLADTLVLMAIPSSIAADETFSYYLLPLISAGTIAVVVYYLGNIGETEGTFGSALKGALISVPYYYYRPQGNIIWCTLASKSTFVRKYRPRPEDNGPFCRRLAKSLFVIGLVAGLTASYFAYNCEIETDDGESVECLDSVRNFFSSSAWQNFKKSMLTLYSYVKYHGWRSLWEDVVKAFDMTDTDSAWKVLGISKSATDQEIKAVYKTLARQFHPDKVKDPEERQAAQEKFMEIQKAYELLSKTKHKRHKHNEKSPTNDRTQL
ncbi:dnaJsubfamily C member 22-like [Tropilaelaps mercedesae]|uniref:DnaJ homolog subfamily C member 22 n=1 Tax=Tropilaelaps mercedesae TaxID=418985 RepID=A0A1V9X2U4_9ACAR|nr:dnaJsubfamily C member 22-like [Tropilaelaps mercedesae]